MRREWSQIKGELAPAFVRGEGKPADRAKLAAFHDKLALITVLDPACGSGNFLYVSLQLLLDLEKELITFATQLDFKFESRVSVQQLKAIELNAYAFELAQVAVQIGYLKWRRDNGFPNEREPVLQNLESFQNEDALLVPHFRSKPKSLKEAQAGEHAADDALKFYNERKWPECDIIVSNPPFLGDKFMRSELGDEYVEELRRTYGDRIPGQSDLCCYWFEKARDSIEQKACKRAGLLATQGIRGGANREVLKRIKKTGDIFFAVSDREWILAGANVHVSMIGFDNGAEEFRELDAKPVVAINANLAGSSDVTNVAKLAANRDIAYVGTTKKAPLDITEETALEFMLTPNPHGRPNSDAIVPYLNADGLVKRDPHVWIIDYPISFSETEAAKYERPFQYVKENVLPLRRDHREAVQARYWWRQARPTPEMKKAVAALSRFVVTPMVSKHRLFSWLRTPCNPDHQLFVFARADDYFFGVLHSRFHEIWTLKLGTRLETRPRYTPSISFETFPFPEPHEQQKHATSAAAKELNDMRENWLNPPEWTTTRVIEFPGSLHGPWSRYINGGTTSVSSQNMGRDSARPSIGTVRYPRIEPRDEDCAKKLAKRTLTNLYNERPAWLVHAHKKLDAAVASAYGWSDLIEILERSEKGEIYDFKTNTYGQVDVGPDGFEPILKKLNEQVNEKILERLLALNQQRAVAEKKSAVAPKKRTTRGRTPEEMI